MEMNFKTKIKGHVLVKDKNTGEVLCDKFNAVHPQNMAKVLARGLANEPNQQIFQIALGNGGTYIDSTQSIVYNSPNIVGISADLYNTTYTEVVDDGNSGVGIGNSVISQAAPSPDISSLVICTIQLSANEPAGQATTDGVTTNPDSLYTFDELGLKTIDGLLLSHIVFNPIEKNAQRELIISYTLTVSVTAS
jgi:hypothetical protein